MTTTTTMEAVRPAPRKPQSTGGAGQQDLTIRVQATLFTLGAVLMPTGVIAVGLGWWGAAHARYTYDQFPYLLSGGLLGVCLTTLGGFLYFGAWQAKVASDQKQALGQLSDSIHALTDVMVRQAGSTGGRGAEDAGAVPVVAVPDGAAVHRRDCSLIAHRADVRVVTPADSGLAICRVCHPTPL